MKNKKPSKRETEKSEHEAYMRFIRMTDEEKRVHLLPREQEYLKINPILYLECLNNKPMADRKGEVEVRDGLILFGIYLHCAGLSS